MRFARCEKGRLIFLISPFKVEELNAAIQRTVRYQVLRKEKDRVQDKLDRFVAQERERSGLSALIGESEAVAKMKAQIQQVAATDIRRCLLLGRRVRGRNWLRELCIARAIALAVRLLP